MNNNKTGIVDGVDMYSIINDHNMVVHALSEADIKIDMSRDLFTCISIWDRLAHEGATIVHAARNIGINCVVNMQNGEIEIRNTPINE